MGPYCRDRVYPVRKENPDSLKAVPTFLNIKKQGGMSLRTSRTSFTSRIEGVFFDFIGRFRPRLTSRSLPKRPDTHEGRPYRKDYDY